MSKKSNLLIFIIFLLLTTVFLIFPSGCKAESHLIINEIQLSGGTGKSTNEFIELYNPTDLEINLKSLPLKLHVVSSTDSDSSKTLTFINETIAPKKYFLITSKKYAEDTDSKGSADATYSTTSGNSLVPNGALYISTSANAKNGIIDFIGLGTNDYFDSNIIINPKDKASTERSDPRKDDWEESCVKGGTPGGKNSSKDDCKSPYLEKIKINELYTEKTVDFVEIKNVSGEKIEIRNWSISDSRHSPKIVNDKKTINPGELYVFENAFYMNVSDDTAKVFDENGYLVDFLNYGKSEKNQSYSFDGKTWQWTSKVTKGAKNEFDKVLSGKIEKEKNIYSDVFADFEVETDGNAKKFTWNFGDGHKSYLKKTRHKYEKSGTYQASLKITGKGKSNILNFEVKVENFGEAEVRIASLSPNPKGIDSKNEWIEISNDTKKKINLKGWSIATGWEKLYNHPIQKDFIIKPGKNKILTRDICAFTLANKQTRIELRYPDGKIADKLKYRYKKGSVREDELYVKDDKGWHWIAAQDDTEKENRSEAMPEDSSLETSDKTETLDNDIEKSDIKISPEELESSLGRFSENPDWQAKKENRIILLSYNSNIKTPSWLLENHGKVLGTEIERSQPEDTHWLIKIIITSLRKFNLFINVFFLKINI